MSGSKEEEKEAFAAVHATLSEWPCSYEFSLRTVKADEEGMYQFLSIWSKPTQTRPVAECVVNMTVKAPMFGGPLRFTFENERHEYTEAEGFGRFVEERIDHMLARKRRELTFIDVVGDFDKTRLPKSYASGEDAELEAAAIRIQGIGRQKLAKKRVASKRKERQRAEAATLIGKVGRGKYAKKRVEDIKREKAATAIGRVGRSKYAKKRVAEIKEKKEQDAAATTIGKVGRRKAAQKRVEEYKARKEAGGDPYKEDLAAAKVQSVARGKRDRERVAAIKKERSGQ